MENENEAPPSAGTLLSQASRITLNCPDWDSDADLRAPSAPSPQPHPLHVGRNVTVAQAEKPPAARPQPHPLAAERRPHAVNPALVFDPRVRAALDLPPDEGGRQLRTFRRSSRQTGASPGPQPPKSSAGVRLDEPQVNSSAWIAARQRKLEQQQFDRRRALSDLFRNKPAAKQAVRARVTQQALNVPRNAPTFRELAAVEPSHAKVRQLTAVPRAPKTLSRSYLAGLANPPPPVEELFFGADADELFAEPLAPAPGLPARVAPASAAAVDGKAFPRVAAALRRAAHFAEFTALHQIGREDLRWESLAFSEWNPEWIQARQRYLRQVASLVHS